MLSNKAFGAALLGLAGLALAQPRLLGKDTPPPATSSGAAGPQQPVNVPPGAKLVARAALPKIPGTQLSIPPGASGRLIVKFMDDVKARATGKQVQSVSAANLSAFQQTVDANGLTVRSAFSLSAETLKKIEDRAAGHSGKAQPDLAGMMYVESPAPGGVPIAAALALNNLPMVEFVEYEPHYVIDGPTGACCLTPPGSVCVEGQTVAACVALGGTYQGDGSACGGANCGACCVPQPNGGSVCQDNFVQALCDGVSGIFQGGGSICTAVDCGGGELDCGQPGAGNCFFPHGSPFCDADQCCNRVCTIDPFCCDADGAVLWPGRGPGHWDEWCAQHALELSAFGVADCAGGILLPCPPGPPPYVPSNPTPNFTDAQGYLTPCPYTAQFCAPVCTCPGLPAVPPVNIAPGLQYAPTGPPDLMPGFTGEGYDLDAVWGVGEILIDAGLATENLCRGNSIKVGVIEHAAFVGSGLGPGAPYLHEELGHVVTERGGNRFLIIPGPFPGDSDNDGHHGTATLGIIGARNNRADGTLRPEGEAPADSLTDQRGMVGIAPDCDLYFFSITTLNGQGVIEAVLRALDDGGANFGPGDVLSFSIGPSGCGTLASSGGGFTVLGVARDIGVTCVISAGNDCCNLDTSGQFGGGDCGVFIVGATYPGASGGINWCRLPLSNYCQDCDMASEVHAAAWGTSVATLGYGNLFVGTSSNDQNRSYTYSFGGTSAAAPQVAGLVACLQGLAKMKWQIPLSPLQIRDLLNNEVDDVNPLACGLGIDFAPGSADSGVPCLTFVSPCPGAPFMPFFANGDWDLGSTDNLIGYYTDAFHCAKLVVTNPWFQENPCPSDIDGNGAVDVLDMLDLLLAWGPNPGHPADIDGDGTVGITDFMTLLSDWGPCG